MSVGLSDIGNIPVLPDASNDEKLSKCVSVYLCVCIILFLVYINTNLLYTLLRALILFHVFDLNCFIVVVHETS